MRVLPPDHRITGEEFVRQIIPLSSIGDMSPDCALSELLLRWYPVKCVLGSCWKGKTIKAANFCKMYEFVMVEKGEYFPNVSNKMPDGCADAAVSWRKP